MAHNGRLLWSHRSEPTLKHQDWADEIQWSVPFILSPEAAEELGRLSPENAKARIHNWLWSSLTKRNQRGPVRGSSYGTTGWGVVEVNYIHGAPLGTAVVYKLSCIGD